MSNAIKTWWTSVRAGYTLAQESRAHITAAQQQQLQKIREQNPGMSEAQVKAIASIRLGQNALVGEWRGDEEAALKWVMASSNVAMMELMFEIRDELRGLRKELAQVPALREELARMRRETE